MKFQAEINVMPLKALLDPQGNAVGRSLHNIGITNLSEVRIGRHITLTVEAKDKASAQQMVDKACRELLHNPIMESYEINIHE